MCCGCDGRGKLTSIDTALEERKDYHRPAVAPASAGEQVFGVTSLRNGGTTQACLVFDAAAAAPPADNRPRRSAAGEQTRRAYAGNFDATSMFGVPTPCDPRGACVFLSL